MHNRLIKVLHACLILYPLPNLVDLNHCPLSETLRWDSNPLFAISNPAYETGEHPVVHRNEEMGNRDLNPD